MHTYLGEVKERVIHFIPVNSHKEKLLFNVINNFLIEHNLNLENCRGQSFYNDANISRKFSLHLVDVSATESCLEAKHFFSYLLKLYNFFSSSPRKWTILTKNLITNDNNKLFRFKSLS